jgi:hypothetical protein
VHNENEHFVQELTKSKVLGAWRQYTKGACKRDSSNSKVLVGNVAYLWGHRGLKLKVIVSRWREVVAEKHVLANKCGKILAIWCPVCFANVLLMCC